MSDMKQDASTEAIDGPVTATTEEELEAHAMMLAALVLGFNEMAKRATSLGGKVFFRLHREEMHKLLRATGSTKWVITFAETAPEDA